MRNWISSDFHLGHANIAGPSCSNWEKGYRNFTSLDEMNYTIIDNLNSMIMPEDTLYFLGDFAFYHDKGTIPWFRSQIRCRNIHLLFGNHDGRLRKRYRDCFTTTQDLLEISLNKNRITLCHFPILVWDKKHYGALHMHGHCHGNLEVSFGRMMDVGVDTNNFKPYLIDDVIDKLLAIDIHALDHHK